MGVSYAIFKSAGKISQHVIPGGYSRIDTPRGNVGPVSANRVVITGECTGGEPNKVLWFTSINDAINTLRSGDLLDAIRFALSPSSDLIPQQVGAVRINSALQASTVLKASGAVDVINAKSRDYGIYTNGIKHNVEAGTNNGFKLTVTLNQDSQVIDDIYIGAINIQYVGDASTAVMTIDNVAKTLTTTLAGDQTDGSANLNVDLTAFDTIEKLVGYVNSQVGYSATLVDGVDETRDSNTLDYKNAIDIKTTVKILTMNIQAMIEAINNQSNYLSDAELDGVIQRNQLDTTIGEVFLTGGSEGTAGTTEHTATATMLEQEDVQCIGTTSDDYAIHAIYMTHIASMNAVTGKKERQGIFGFKDSDTLNNSISAGAIAQAKVANSGAVGYTYGNLVEFDLNGNEQNYGSVYYASKMIGQFGALDIIQPHTFKEFSAVDLLTKLSVPEKEKAILNGIWVPEVSPQGTFRTVRSITTYQKDNLLWNEFSMARTALYVSRDLRNYLEQTFVGLAGDTTILASIRTLSGARLNTYRTDDNFFVDNPAWNNVSWKDLVISINGDQVELTYDATVTAPINFVFITNKFSIIASL
jgi:hypothetical protein